MKQKWKVNLQKCKNLSTWLAQNKKSNLELPSDIPLILDPILQLIRYEFLKNLGIKIKTKWTQFMNIS